jgi:hypothetical protein
MIAPTPDPDEAADLIAQACIAKPVRIATRLGLAGQLLHASLPRVAQIVMNISFRLFPDTPTARGAQPGEPVPPQTLSAEAMALQQMMRGIHF